MSNPLDHYLAGDPDQPAILLMHSLSDSNAIMEDLAQAYHQADYSVYYPNFTHHADHNIKAIMQTPFDQYQSDGQQFFEDLKKLGHDEIILGGMSLGGMVALDLAVKEEGVQAIISIATPIFVDMVETKVPYMIRQRYFKSLGRKIEAGDRQEADQLTAKLKENLRTFNLWMEEVFDPLQSLQTPIFIGQGQEDEVVGPVVGERLNRLMKEANPKEFQLYEAGQHYLTDEQTFDTLKNDSLGFLRTLQ